MEARQNLDQRRLAGAVLAEQAVHLAFGDLERAAVEGLLAPEGLAEIPEAKGRRRLGLRARIRQCSFHKSA